MERGKRTKFVGREDNLESDLNLLETNSTRNRREKAPYSPTIESSPKKLATRTEGAEPKYYNSVDTLTTTARTALSQWTNIVLMITLIFGGCCANVFALEAIIKERPNSGPLITFAQFLLTATFTSPSFLSLAAGPCSFFLNKRYIPLKSWITYTAFFVTVNLLNNWAFAYQISVPLHIILRSGGPVASMIVGYLYGSKRYSGGQILAVAMLTSGVAISALADAQAKGQSINIGIDQGSEITSTFVGFAILALAMILSAFQGIYADKLYETYGRNHWKEALFYSHVLSLPIFLPTYSQLLSQWRALLSSPPLISESSAITLSRWHYCDTELDEIATLRDTCIPSIAIPVIGAFSRLLAPLQEVKTLHNVLAGIPVQVAFLFMNAFTQYWCIRGVHLLSAKSSSLTVTIVLNIRKLVSLLLSIWIFGNNLSQGVLIGAVLVFVGGAVYGFEGARPKKTARKTD